MCAQASYNLSDGVQYYKGQKALEYNVPKNDTGEGMQILNYFGSKFTWLFQNGTEATGLIGSFDRYKAGGTFSVYTYSDHPSTVAVQRTILRSCT